MLGGFGDAEIFSFHATKVAHSFEGGAITTNDAELADQARLMRNFGFKGYDEVTELGTNGKMSEASAAMGLTSLESLDGFLAANQRNFEQYRDRLGSRPGLALAQPASGNRWNHHYVVVEIDRDATGLARDELHRLLWAEGVLARQDTSILVATPWSLTGRWIQAPGGRFQPPSSSSNVSFACRQGTLSRRPRSPRSVI